MEAGEQMGNYLRWYSINALDGHYQDFYYRDGETFNNNLSEELDSGMIIIDRIEKTNFESFDIIEVFNDNWSVSKTLLIDKIVETQVCFEPELFSYTIQLMSMTKSLERIPLPNVSETKPLNGTSKTIYDKLKEILEDYCPKYFYKNGDIIECKNLISISQQCETALGSTKCPDISLGNSTLREAIDRLFSVIYGICSLNSNNELEFVDLNQKNNSINLSDYPEINYKHENEDSVDYASELENNYKNVVQDVEDKTDKSKTVRIIESMTFRDKNRAYIDSNNLSLYTSRPIYEIKSIKIRGYIDARALHIGDINYYYLNNDITANLLEAETYAISDYTTQYKSIQYRRGGNEIYGFNNSQTFLGFEITVIERIISNIVGHQIRFSILGLYQLMSLHFTIEYYSQVSDIKVKAGKYLPETHQNNAIIDNPTEGFVDIKQQGRLFNQKVNRLGNRAKNIIGRFLPDRFSVMPKLGDYIGDFIIINTEIQYFDDFATYKATLTENFVNINYFTGINARKRSWNVVSAGEAFDKELLDKYYFELSFKEKTGNDIYLLTYTADSSYNVAEIALRGLILYYSYDKGNPVYGALVWTDESDESLETSLFPNEVYGRYFFLETSSYIAGNSIVFNFGFDGNKTNGIRVSNELSDILTFKVIQKLNKYTDKNGKAKYFNCMLVNSNYFLGKGNTFTYTEDGESKTANYDGPLNKTPGSSLSALEVGKNNYENTISRNYPKVYCPTLTGIESNNELFFTRITNNKDSRETININIQFEFCSDTPDIIIGSDALEYQRFISGGFPTGTSLKVYLSNHIYKNGDDKLISSVGDVTSLTTTTINRGENTQTSASLLININSTISHKSIVFKSNTSSKIIFAINTINFSKTMYLNILKNRDRKIYLDKLMKTWIPEQKTKTIYKKITSNDELTDGEYLLVVRDRTIIGPTNYLTYFASSKLQNEQFNPLAGNNSITTTIPYTQDYIEFDISEPDRMANEIIIESSKSGTYKYIKCKGGQGYYIYAQGTEFPTFRTERYRSALSTLTINIDDDGYAIITANNGYKLASTYFLPPVNHFTWFNDYGSVIDKPMLFKKITIIDDEE